MRAPRTHRCLATLVGIACVLVLSVPMVSSATGQGLLPGLFPPATTSTDPEPTATTAPTTTPDPAASGDASTPVGQPCFGAAAVDPNKPCSNPGLALTVYPQPQNARDAQRTERCEYREAAAQGLLDVCYFGASVEDATRTVALLGDSHAAHWRAALDSVLKEHHWRAISIQRAGCPLTLAHPNLPGQDRQKGCMAWNRAVLEWMAAHPQIDVVFTSQHRGTVIPKRGQAPGVARRAGYIASWQSLLAHYVKHIVVIRDTPRITGTTIPCVESAIADHVAPGAACALKSSFALRSDPAVDAAKQLASPQVQVADLATFFCQKRMCSPVLGGALVLRDVSHMTTTYSRSLGPYLAARVDLLMQSWTAARSTSTAVPPAK